MKKIIAALAIASLSVSAMAQTQVGQSKFFDNWYVGVEGGVATKTLYNSWTKNLNPTAGVRIGRNINTVLGLQFEGNVYFDQKARESHWGNSMFVGTRNEGSHHLGNWIKKATIMGELTFNLSNALGGYKGEPRAFEVIGVAGAGIGHDFRPGKSNLSMGRGEDNQMVAKVGLDFAYNLGADKAWQLFIEPALIWDIADNDICEDWIGHKFNLDASAFQLIAGLNYKFKNSNGTHNFALVELKDQALIDRLNGNVNDLRNELAGKDAEIANLKKKLNDCENKPVVQAAPMVTNIMPKVFFKCAKWNVEDIQVANVEMVAEYMKENPNSKVLCKGYASVDGKTDSNNVLAVKRANVVRDMLIEKYGIDPSRLTAEGCGETEEHSSVLDFNRVTTFHDVTNK